MWFTQIGNGDRVGKITMSETITEYTRHDSTSDTTGDGTDGIAVGSDGHIWVVEAGLGDLAKIDPAGGAFTEYHLGLGPSGTPLQDIAAAPNGVLWLSAPAWGVQFTPGSLSAISTTDGSVITSASLPGYVKVTTFASDSSARLFRDPLGDFWADGIGIYQISP